MSRYVKFLCLECGWQGKAYCNKKKCPKCGGELERVVPLLAKIWSKEAMRRMEENRVFASNSLS